MFHFQIVINHVDFAARTFNLSPLTFMHRLVISLSSLSLSTFIIVCTCIYILESIGHLCWVFLSLSFSLSPDSHLAMCYSSCVCVSLMWPFFVLYWSHSPNDLLQNLLLLFTGPDLFLHFCCALVHVLSFHKCVE